VPGGRSKPPPIEIVAAAPRFTATRTISFPERRWSPGNPANKPAQGPCRDLRTRFEQGRNGAFPVDARGALPQPFSFPWPLGRERGRRERHSAHRGLRPHNALYRYGKAEALRPIAWIFELKQEC
jgi:hypothetical protein